MLTWGFALTVDFATLGMVAKRCFLQPPTKNEQNQKAKNTKTCQQKVKYTLLLGSCKELLCENSRQMALRKAWHCADCKEAWGGGACPSASSNGRWCNGSKLCIESLLSCERTVVQSNSGKDHVKFGQRSARSWVLEKSMFKRATDKLP